ncbi:MAG TPA: hypothetical protein VH741_01900 [Candidatus Limnocylindrales bacterium]|jgi:hypothetical protein
MAPPPPAAAPGAPSPLDNLVATMGLSQLLIVGAALALVLLEIIFGKLLREYFVSDVAWVASGFILLAFAATRGMPTLLPFSYRSVLLGGAWAIVLVGANQIVYDVLALGRSTGGMSAFDLLGLLIFVGAVIAAGWGAWTMRNQA